MRPKFRLHLPTTCPLYNDIKDLDAMMIVATCGGNDCSRALYKERNKSVKFIAEHDNDLMPTKCSILDLILTTCVLKKTCNHN